jgi:hypothetical protein
MNGCYIDYLSSDAQCYRVSHLVYNNWQVVLLAHPKLAHVYSLRAGDGTSRVSVRLITVKGAFRGHRIHDYTGRANQA